MNTTDDGLLPCPWCLETNVILCRSIYLDQEAFAVSCRTKRCHGAIFKLGYGLFETDVEAIAAWNTRTTPSLVTHDEVERIFAELDAETAELPDMDAAQIAYATRCVRKALAHAVDRDACQVRDSSQQSSDMVERVARAICLDNWSSLTNGHRDHFRERAHAALEASHHADLVEALAKIRRCFVSMPDEPDDDIRRGNYAFAIEAVIQTIDKTLGMIGGGQ